MIRIIAICIGVFLSVTSFGQKKVLDRVIAVVGDEPLFLSELDGLTKYYASKGLIKSEQDVCGVLEQILTEKLLVNQAAVDSISVTESEVMGQVDSRISQIMAYMGNDEQKFKEYYGKSVQQVRYSLKDEMRNQLLTQRMRSTVLGQVSVTPSEVKAFFERNQDTLPFYSEEVEISEVVVFPKPNAIQKGLAYDLLYEVREKVLSGEATFEDMAKKYSQDPGSKATGGDLGLVRRGSFVPEFEATAFNLEKGEYSEVFETAFGYHFLQLLDRKGNYIHTRHILIKPEIKSLDEDKVVAQLDSVKHLLEVDSISFREAVATYSSDNVQSKNTAGYIMNPKTGTTKFELGDVDFDLFFILDTMKTGNISSPISFTSPRGEKGFKVIKLLSRTPAHKASLEQDYYKIKAMALEEKKNDQLKSWVDKVVANTYLFIDEDFQKCENLNAWLTNSKVSLSYKR